MKRRSSVQTLCGTGLAVAVLALTVAAAPEGCAEPVTPPAAAATLPGPSAAPQPGTGAAGTAESGAPETLAPAEFDGAALAEAVGAAVRGRVPGTEFGLHLHDRLSGTTVASAGAERPFYTASVVKLLIAVDRIRDAGWRLPEAERAGLTAMLAGSSDGVASAWWDPTVLDPALGDLIGLRETTPPRRDADWELTRMSARDVSAAYEFIAGGLPAEASAFTLDTLSGATDPAADGFAQYFGIPDALPGTPWAVKQGWMRVADGLVLNTTGLAGPDLRYVVVLLTEQPAGTSYAAGRAAVTAGIGALAPILTAAAR
ncbi:hypothetical protein CFN78_05065 [Amycolatopsis antarctica]|uniref:Serine hydrolase n=1 Tax=Amycolatopsis antarctica TaxID=1854586 RepID=A0A263D901_9PSEU|nr:hypothetical protein [Amycolatopsis antarctica]OZM74488.1 hypothetical protein CFN78_05065 [Amycolatopsis antarctica]